MDRKEIVTAVEESGIVAVIRMRETQKLLKVVDAIRQGGVEIVEITMTVPNALEMIAETATALGPGVPVGVGSVITADAAHAAVDAGASFIVSPVFKAEVVQAAHERGVPAMPGAFTPTEALTAHELGADVIKIFPADVVGMPFFKGILAPMPFLKLMPTGGVSLDNAGDWVRAGAVAVGVGSALLDKSAIEEERYDVLTEKARRLRASFDSGRQSRS